MTSQYHSNIKWGQIRSRSGRLYSVQALKGQHWTKMISYNEFVRTCWAYGSIVAPEECTPWH